MEHRSRICLRLRSGQRATSFRPASGSWSATGQGGMAKLGCVPGPQTFSTPLASTTAPRFRLAISPCCVSTRVLAGGPQGVYAILHVIEPPSERADDDDRFYSDKRDAEGLKWRGRFRLLSNLVDAPVRAETLPDEAEFAHLKRALQTSSIPLALSAFKTLLRVGGVDPLEINVAQRAEDSTGLAELASAAANPPPRSAAPYDEGD